MISRSLGHRAPLLWLVVPFMAGLIAGKIGELLPVPWQLGLAAAGIGLAVVGVHRVAALWIPGILVAMFFAGSGSYALQRARLPAWDALPPREARLGLRVERVFVSDEPRRSSGLATIVRADEHLRDLRGQRIYFSLALRRGEAPPTRSAVIAATGVLVTLPRDPPAGSFDGYLAGAGVNFRLTRGRIEATEQAASAYYRFCERAAGHFARLLEHGVAAKRPELAGVLVAMMLGKKHELSDEQNTLFMRSGTMHLFAISGLHIGVIATAIHALLALLRLPRALRFGLGLVALWLYVDITGATPSAVRAFIMVALVESSLVLRVPGNPLAALVASALVVMVLWPLQVFSASFQMSYGIVAALLLFGLPLSDHWLERTTLFRDLPKPAWAWHQRAIDAARRAVIPAVAIGVASTIISTISGVLFFQLLTPGSLLANLLLIPASVVVIWAGLASLLAGLAGATALGGLFNHAAVLTLAAIDAGVRAVVAVPGVWRPAQFIAPWVGPAAFAAVLAAMVAGYAWHWRRHRGGWWPPLALLGLTLWLGTSYG